MQRHYHPDAPSCPRGQVEPLVLVSAETKLSTQFVQHPRDRPRRPTATGMGTFAQGSGLSDF
jgi:hypothetical protein